jgi:mRNA interferase YafQ
MLNPVYTNIFKKEYKRAIKRGQDIEALDLLMDLIIEEQPIPARYKKHLLTGNWKGRWDCHIAPDWLLLFKIDGDEVIFERTGSHADLF